MIIETEINPPAKITILDDAGLAVAVRYYKSDGTFIDQGQAVLFEHATAREAIAKLEEHLK